VIFYVLTDIERMYGQRKLIAKRVPVVIPKAMGAADGNSDVNQSGVDDLPVPAMTDDETATDTELETETEAEMSTSSRKRARSKYQDSTSGSSGTGRSNSIPQKKVVSQHDLFNKYFRRDTVILKNIDLLRSAPFVTIHCVLITTDTQG
jgi:phosphatidylethanolamine N-methyltransferase